MATDNTHLQPTVPNQLATQARPLAAACIPGWLSEGRYTYLETLGAGGMGQVFLVHDNQLLRQVALKVLRPEQSAESARLLDEARAVCQLEHPHIVPLYDVGRSSTNEVYYTMQYVKSHSLADALHHLRQGQSLEAWPFQKRAQMLVDLCDALAFAHARCVLHGDVKPANILVSDRQEVLLTDWGISGPAGHDTCSSGTPGYMAPETLTQGVHSVRSEIFSLGVVMYQLLTLHNPFNGQTADDINDSVLKRSPAAPDSLSVKGQGRVPRELALVCMRCLARDPQQRYATVSDVARDIEAYLHGLAAVVCVQTGLKRAVYGLARLSDNHGALVIVGLCFLVTVPMVTALCWLLVR